MAEPETYDVVPTEEDVPKWKVYKKRWLMLSLFTFYAIMGGLQWTEFSSVAPTLMAYYGVSHEALEWTSLVYMLCYIILFLPVQFCISKMSTRNAVLLGVSGTTLGAIIKVFSVHPHRFYVIMVGQVAIAIGEVFMYHLLGRVASIWFGANEISIGNTLCLIGDEVGIAIGFYMSSTLVGNYKTYDSHFEDSLLLLNILVAGLSCTLFILMFFFFQNKPPLPPSYSKGVQYNTEKKKFWASLKGILTKHFMLSAIPYGATVACGAAILVMLGSLINKKIPGTTDAAAGLLGCIFLVSGILGSLISSCILDKTRQFKKASIFSSGFTLINHIFFIYFLNTGSLIGTCITIGLYGFFAEGYYGYGMQLVIEVTYPMAEEISCGYTVLGFQLSTILVTNMYSWAVFYFNDYRSEALLGVILLLSFIMNILNRGKMKRQQLELKAAELHPISSHK